MDYSSMLKMSYELNSDTFEAGKSYHIKIHTQELFSKVVGVSLCPDDDVIDGDINTAYKKLYNHLDEVGVDAICTSVSTRVVEFMTSTRNVRRCIVKMSIAVPLDVILVANDNKNAGVTPAIEII